MFSSNWNTIYKYKKQINHWPWDNLISHFNHFFKIKKKLKVLELGFGTGGNALFFIKNKIYYIGLEGSKIAVNKVKKQFPNFKKNFICGDFTKRFPNNKKYDLIFDRGSVTHNKDEDILHTIKLIKKSLKKNGYFFGIDWFSKKHYLSEKGRSANKKKDFSRVYKNGPLKNVGIVNFFTKKKLEFFFNDFQIIQIEEKNKTIFKNKKKPVKISFFNIIVKKK